MKKNNVMHCIFSKWYPTFKDITIKSHTIALSKEFIDYLCADGVVLPEGSVIGVGVGQDAAADTETQKDWTSENTAEEAEAPCFPELDVGIEKYIKMLGGEVFPKLNWSAPKDATWISYDNTLKCTCASEIYLLLKSSDFITHDLTEPFIHCDDYEPDEKIMIPYELVIRRWHDLDPSGEFRCFVRDNHLIGVTQRNHASFFPFIHLQMSDILNDILSFYFEKISGKFPDSDYVFDVYRKDKGKVYLIDFNPFGETTDSLLFSWTELRGSLPIRNGRNLDVAEAEGAILRCVSSKENMSTHPLQYYSVPKDFVDLATGEDPQKLMDFLQMKTHQQDEETSEEEQASRKPFEKPP